jgi:HEPN domain-containing protein
MDLAKEDIDVADVLFQGGKRLYMGFMCHLAVEKALKAKVETVGEQSPKIHNLVRLANMGGLYAVLTPERQRFLESLNPLNIEARYPPYKSAIAESLTDEACKQLLTGTKELVSWIEQQL